VSGCGATRTNATTTDVMNNTRVCAALELSVREAANALARIDDATNSKPTSAPATGANTGAKFAQLETL